MKLKNLRNEMKKNNISAYIIPTLDPHSSDEYLCDYYKEREYITGFTGSNGIALVTDDDAFMWTDGRYFLQADKQLKDSGFKLMKMATEGYPSLNEWVKDNLSSNDKIGINGKYFTQKAYEDLKSYTDAEIVDIDLIKNIWENRPSLPQDKAFIHDIKYCGVSTDKKLEDVRKILKEKDCEYLLLTSLEDVAWLFNIRGNDIKHTPVVFSYGIIGLQDAKIYIENYKLTEEVKKYLEKFAKICPYEDIYEEVKALNGKVSLNIENTNCKLFNSIKDKICDDGIVKNLRLIKNEIELDNTRKSHIRDGVYLTKFIYYIKHLDNLENLTEFDAANILHDIRAKDELFFDESFETIAGYKENGAIIHYAPTKEESKKLSKSSFLLVDSGAQYLDGTTDVTRTIALGDLTYDEKKDFTLVLKSYLALHDAKFLKNTPSSSLDMLSRYPLWLERENFNHSTGHGVGFFLGVHEVPPLIGMRNFNPISLHTIVSNEPGIYKAGKYGIRTENLMIVVEDIKTEENTFYKFETITYAPFEINAILPELLTKREKLILNEYNKKVYELLNEYLTEEEREWLKEVTKPLD